MRVNKQLKPLYHELCRLRSDSVADELRGNKDLHRAMQHADGAIVRINRILGRPDYD
jgi:hypothetical protein